MNVRVRFIAACNAGLALVSLAGCGPDGSMQYDLELSRCNGIGFNVMPYESAELEHYEAAELRYGQCMCEWASRISTANDSLAAEAYLANGEKVAKIIEKKGGLPLDEVEYDPDSCEPN